MGCFKASNPDEPCCCEYDRDEFPTTLDANWVDEVGSWATSGVLQTTSANAYIKRDVEQPNSLPNIAARVRFRGSDGAQPRILLDNLDEDNYIFAQFTIGDPYGSLELGRMVAGVIDPDWRSKFQCELPAATWHTATLEWGKNKSGIYDSALVSVAGRSIALWLKTTATENFAGLGTGAIPSGTVEFDDWSLSRTDDDCENIRETCVLVDEFPARVDPGDDSDAGPTFEEVAGDWNYALATSDTNAIMLFNVALPPDSAGLKLSLGFEAGDALIEGLPDYNDYVIYFNWVDSDNHSYVYLHYGIYSDSELKIVDVVGGIETVIGGPETRTGPGVPGGPILIGLSLCWAEDMVTATVSNDFSVSATLTTPAERRRFGFGTGAQLDSVANVVSLDTVYITQSEDHPDCDDCVPADCSSCDSDFGVPERLLLTIPGFPSIILEFAGTCFWVAVVEDSCIIGALLATGGPGWQLELYSGVGMGAGYESELFEGELNCMDTFELTLGGIDGTGCGLPETITLEPYVP